MGAGIYKLTSPNGKSYVGQSVSLKKRINRYKLLDCKQQVKIFRAINKYGWENITVELLWSTKNEYRYKNLNILLNALEKHWIMKFDCIKNGYNLKTGGANGRHSEETKRKISKSTRGRVLSQKTKDRISKAHKGRPANRDAIARMVKSMEGYYHTDKTRLKMSIASKGKRKTKKHSENISKGLTGVRHSTERTNNKKIPIYQYSIDGTLIRRWESSKDASIELGISRGNLCNVLKGRAKTTGGFKWTYVS